MVGVAVVVGVAVGVVVAVGVGVAVAVVVVKTQMGGKWLCLELANYPAKTC